MSCYAVMPNEIENPESVIEVFFISSAEGRHAGLGSAYGRLPEYARGSGLGLQ